MFMLDMWRGNKQILNVGGQPEGEDSLWLGSIEILKREVSLVATLLNPTTDLNIISERTRKNKCQWSKLNTFLKQDTELWRISFTGWTKKWQFFVEYSWFPEQTGAYKNAISGGCSTVVLYVDGLDGLDGWYPGGANNHVLVIVQLIPLLVLMLMQLL